ncbi:hypothetical protein G7054_g5744 [Neopestalotiopsis clavispora]|nr:hypothetical protein G7054_g5744 [Neopestalotiopsis clavispora]
MDRLVTQIKSTLGWLHHITPDDQNIVDGLVSRLVDTVRAVDEVKEELSTAHNQLGALTREYEQKLQGLQDLQEKVENMTIESGSILARPSKTLAMSAGMDSSTTEVAAKRYVGVPDAVAQSRSAEERVEHLVRRLKTMVKRGVEIAVNVVASQASQHKGQDDDIKAWLAGFDAHMTILETILFKRLAATQIVLCFRPRVQA